MPAAPFDHGELIALDSESVGDAVVVHVTGELDLPTAAAADAELARAVDSGARAVVVDLDKVHFLGSSGLRVLLTVRDKAEQGGVDLRLVCQERVVVRPLEVTGLLSAFQIHPSVREAVDAAAQRAR
ncbi:hypothetical protein GCM10010174_75990 [Kutzneria viridogrisea]|uniref:Anti-sigma factor antagonist n=2 Tax=Kutzneria TaxID=43356 RepID=W5WDY6_9PSEU|nr:STAS domain-containing protein [Kutzneria albida]AHH96399.1 hypothetical protein KALB_3031 [Kutzneria albida DSM 43870]MBA8928385.1 anti-anti-sigma factor [Kutzneria viridogrisea]